MRIDTRSNVTKRMVTWTMNCDEMTTLCFLLLENLAHFREKSTKFMYVCVVYIFDTHTHKLLLTLKNEEEFKIFINVFR